MIRKLVMITTLAGAGLLVAGCVGPPEHTELAQAPAAEAPPSEKRFSTEIHRPYLQLGVTTARRDLHGKPGRVPCAVCHATIVVKAGAGDVAHAEGFHEGVKLDHGDATCTTCHRGPAFDDFQLAGGRVVSYVDVMELCAQCHGAVHRDYLHGAHGGMNGHWDLDAGPRLRNHCLDCHNAHAPRIPTMRPAPLPRYRFVSAERSHE